MLHIIEMCFEDYILLSFHLNQPQKKKTFKNENTQGHFTYRLWFYITLKQHIHANLYYGLF